MTLFPYLQLQPIDPQDDGTVSDLDKYEEDDIIDLENDTDGETLVRELDAMIKDLHSQDTNQSVRN